MNFVTNHPFLFTFLLLTVLWLLYSGFIAYQQAQLLEEGVKAGIIKE